MRSFTGTTIPLFLCRTTGMGEHQQVAKRSQHAMSSFLYLTRRFTHYRLGLRKDYQIEHGFRDVRPATAQTATGRVKIFANDVATNRTPQQLSKTKRGLIKAKHTITSTFSREVREEEVRRTQVRCSESAKQRAQKAHELDITCSIDCSDCKASTVNSDVVSNANISISFTIRYSRRRSRQSR